MTIQKQKKAFFFGITIVSLFLALNEFFQPSEVRPDGRWSVVYAWTWDAWGSLGVAGFFLVEAVVFAVIAFSIRSEK
ncbi:hypothetical protein ACWKW4_01745 [Hydrogenophaga borbori]